MYDTADGTFRAMMGVGNWLRNQVSICFLRAKDARLTKFAALNGNPKGKLEAKLV